MAIFEVESWLVQHGKEQEHDEWLRRWLKWVKEHRDLFPEWKSVRYFQKHAAGEETHRRFIMWEYESYADYERYKTRRKDYEGPYAEYKKNDPYYQDLFIYDRMTLEFWKDLERDLWIE